MSARAAARALWQTACEGCLARARPEVAAPSSAATWASVPGGARCFAAVPTPAGAPTPSGAQQAPEPPGEQRQQHQANKNTLGGVSWGMVGSILAAGTITWVYLQHAMAQKRQAGLDKFEKSEGEAQVGGPFQLTDTDGKPFGSEQLKGEFSVLYFGFTHCPDICPDELEKLAEAIDMVEQRAGIKVKPVFITVDPDRDSAKTIKSYCKDFHKRMVGLRGSMEDVKRVAKLFRVYFMRTNDSNDYLVDHSIIMYLLDPDAKFVTFYGKSFTAEQIANGLMDRARAWKKQHSEYQVKLQ